jgi:malate synthase
MEILNIKDPRLSKLLNDDIRLFLTDLHNTFNPSIISLLETRKEIQIEIDNGKLPTLLKNNKSWTVGSIPEPLLNRTIEITGPVSRKMVINALNSGANCFMADFEDASSPTWSNMINGQINLRDAINKTISFYDQQKNKSYKLNEETATLMVRPRGLHMIEKNVKIKGGMMRASLFDFGVYFATNFQQLIENGAGPYFYIPKLENHNEAKLWDDIFKFSEHYFGLNIGTIKATVLIEHILAAFQMEEILFSMKDHIVGLNCGRWDYIFSFIKKFKYNPNFILPNRSQITMSSHFMSSYVKLLTYTCHKRGAYAMGGMAAQIPSKDFEINKKNLDKVYHDKLSEAKSGMDGTWIAHPKLLENALKAFNEYKTENNQLHRLDDYNIISEDLLEVPQGEITFDGVKDNVITFLQYLDAWISGKGCVALNNKMEDAATAEISRMQLWQWIYHEIKINDVIIDSTYINKIIEEDKTEYKNKEIIMKLFNRFIYEEQPQEFLTTRSYQFIN